MCTALIWRYQEVILQLYCTLAVQLRSCTDNVPSRLRANKGYQSNSSSGLKDIPCFRNLSLFDNHTVVFSRKATMTGISILQSFFLYTYRQIYTYIPTLFLCKWYILVSQGCHNKTSQTRWLKLQIFIFQQFLKFRSPRQAYLLFLWTLSLAF